MVVVAVVGAGNLAADAVAVLVPPRCVRGFVWGGALVRAARCWLGWLGIREEEGDGNAARDFELVFRTFQARQIKPSTEQFP